MSQEINDYLATLGYDVKKWTVLKKDEWFGLAAVPGYQNNMYDSVKDPVGRSTFGKDARIVEVEWYAKHKHILNKADPAGEPVAEAPKASSIPAPPPIPKVPEAVAEEPKSIPAVPPVVEEKEAPKSVQPDGTMELRIAQLKSMGWNSINENVVESKHGIRKTLEEIGAMEDREYFQMMLPPTNIQTEPVKAEEPKVEPKVEIPQPTEEDLQEQRNIARNKRTKARIDFLLNQGFKYEGTMDKDLILIDPDGVQSTQAEIQNCSEDEWMELTVYYNPKNIKDRKDETATRAKKEKEASKAIEDQKQHDLNAGYDADEIKIDFAKRVEADKLKAEEESKAAEAIVDNPEDDAEHKNKSMPESVKGIGVENAKGFITNPKDNAEIVSAIDKNKARNLSKNFAKNFLAGKEVAIADGTWPNSPETTGSLGGLFALLADVGFQQLNLSVTNLGDGKFKLKADVKDEERLVESIGFKVLEGTPEEIEKSLLNIVKTL